MNIAIVTINQENAAIASWLAAQDFSGCTLAHWQIEPQPVVAEQVLDAYYGFLGKERPPFAFMVQREEVYADRASDAEKEAGIHSFISLEQLGEEIR